MPPEAVDLVSRLLQYSPHLRSSAVSAYVPCGLHTYRTQFRVSESHPILMFMQLDALIHPFFDELRDPNTRLPNGRFLPPLFNFKPHGKHTDTHRSATLHHHQPITDCLTVSSVVFIRAEGTSDGDRDEAGPRAREEPMPLPPRAVGSGLLATCAKRCCLPC